MAVAAIASNGIVQDRWLSDILDRPAWRVDSLIPDPAGAVRQSGGFYYTRIPTGDVARLHAFEDAGFHVVDTAITLEAKTSTLVPSDPAIARFAQPSDRAAVAAIAGSAFESSRLHLDPAIPNALADRSRAEWAGNFFAGTRGNAMVVADHNGEAAAFLLLTGPIDDTLTIDLIGVRRDARRRGLGAGCIHFAAGAIASQRIRVGTQAANIPSLSLYESLGFHTVASDYVLHLHRT